MLRAIVGFGLLAAAQAYITSQTRARRQRLAGAVETQSLRNWEDEGGSVVGTIGNTGAPAQIGPALATGTMGGYPSGGQTG